ncbi:hypothetical protein Deima_2536 [Deinococcus maricopensis DSM 21211]|uniref:MalT-like TPR region domain-containing protein n=2 Tax=Deinococcus TaxID=1298 RepID=E8UAT1_DEIML|nr:hypothetical protein Deima_2536 [Deinococcus maricopensis DSM 21211]
MDYHEVKSPLHPPKLGKALLEVQRERLSEANDLWDSSKIKLAEELLSREAPLPELAPDWYYLQSRCFDFLGNLEKSEYYLSLAAESAKQKGDLRLIGQIKMSSARFLIIKRKHDEALEVMHQALATLKGNKASVAWVLSNLGNEYLGRLRLDHAVHYLEQALSTTRVIKDARYLNSNILQNLSEAARLKGDFSLARSRALQALKSATQPYFTFTANIHLGHALRISGDPLESLRAYHAALASNIDGNGAHRAKALIWIAEKQLNIHLEPPEEKLLTLIGDRDAARIELHLADLAYSNGHLERALSLLQNAFERDEPAAFVDEAWVLGELYAFARHEGLEMPLPPLRVETPTIQIQTLGTPTIRINDRTVTVQGSSKVVALLAYLHSQGVVPWERVVTDLLGIEEETRGYTQVKYLLSQARHMIGDSKAVLLTGGRVSLSERWTWSSDLKDALEHKAQPKALFLPDLYLDWVLEMRARLGQD